jgi:hypothetical protein
LTDFLTLLFSNILTI